MPHLYQVSERDLRAMAREAAALFLDGRATPTDAVIKVASVGGLPLTSEHARRICEMTYHEIFERSFRGQSGPDRVVNFDPPDAAKVASAVRATQVQSFHDKVASGRAGGEMEKAASAPVPQAPVPQNAFARAMANYAQDPAPMKKEAHGNVRRLHAEVREAVRALETQVHSASGSEKLAFFDLAGCLVTTVRNGVPPLHALAACLEFAKTADAPESVLDGMAQDLVRALRRADVDLDNEKTASRDHLVLNEHHPLRVQSIKVAELRGFKIRGQVALDDLRYNAARVERELQDALYR